MQADSARVDVALETWVGVKNWRELYSPKMIEEMQFDMAAALAAADAVRRSPDISTGSREDVVAWLESLADIIDEGPDAMQRQSADLRSSDFRLAAKMVAAAPPPPAQGGE